MSNWTLIFGTGFAIVATFDVYWFLRLAYTRLLSYFRRPISVTEDSIIYSICSTSDIDYFCHMNNGKYFRECDFGRFDFYFRSGLSRYFQSHKEMYVVQHAAMIRYRRSLNFLMPFIVKTKLIYFDQRSLFFEQSFISKPDNFVRAVALCKNTVVNCDVLALMKTLYGLEQPKCPDDLLKFIEANEISSNKLKMKGHPVSEATSLVQMDDDVNNEASSKKLR